MPVKSEEVKHPAGVVDTTRLSHRQSCGFRTCALLRIFAWLRSR
jgi:hypothetical protein